MPGRLQGKVAVISGAASGIGQAYARRLAEDGADVAVADVLPASETEALVEEAGRDCLVQHCDVSSADDVRALAEAVQQRFGQADILINNAGIYPAKPFLEMDFSEWRRVLSINLDSMFHMCQAFAPGMRQRGWGRIVNVSSGTFLRAPAGMSHYVASKAGVIGFTRVLARELGQYGITVNAIAPGLTATETVLNSPQADWLADRDRERAIPRRELAEDLVGALAYLVSDDAAFYTGQTMLVDGGAGFL